jgi:hypothetical protein
MTMLAVSLSVWAATPSPSPLPTPTSLPEGNGFSTIEQALAVLSILLAVAAAVVGYRIIRGGRGL